MSKFIKEKYEVLNEQIPKLISEGKTIREMSNILNVSKSAIDRRCRVLNISVPNYHNSLKFNNTIFDSIDTEEKAYWLGFLYADGSVHSKSNIVSISLKREDREHLVKFKNFLEAQANIIDSSVFIKDKEYKVSKFSVCNKHLKETLINLGCIPKKSLVLTFPNSDIFKERELVYDFIRGYVDGDGCLTFSRNGRLNLNILGTKEFLEGILKVFPNKFSSIFKAKRIKTNVWTISNCGSNADDVTYKLYSKATIYLDRKYDRFAVLNRKV